jgi:hypothetical protein
MRAATRLALSLAMAVMVSGPVVSVRAEKITDGPLTVEQLAEFGRTEGRKGFFGHYGYVVALPENYSVFAKFVDDAKTVEVAWFFPSEVDPAFIESEAMAEDESQQYLYGQHGVVRLEVVPRGHDSFGRDHPDLAMLQEGFSQWMVEEGWKFVMKPLAVARPAFQAVISEPTPLNKVIVEGQKVVDVFTAGADDQIVQALAGSLKEINPHEQPGK